MKHSRRSHSLLPSLAVLGLLAAGASAQEAPREPDLPRDESWSLVLRAPVPAATPERRLAERHSSEPELPDASTAAASISRHGHDRMDFDEPGDGNVWVRGANYKASFGADGAVFYPRLGARAPRNVPHALSPDLVTIAGMPIPFKRDATAVRTDDRVELDRGSFVEAYDVALESMEQTFVFATLPARGEIVVRIPVASAFKGRATEDGLEFRGQLGAVRYSRAVAVDALDRRADTRTEIVDGAIEIVVGAEFVSTAVLPLVIDPYIFSVDVGPQENFAADLAWNQGHFGWIAVFEEVYSATDHDVRAMFMSFPGVWVQDAYLDLTTANCAGPRVANLNAHEQCLVVFSASGPVPRVFGREVDMVQYGVGPRITIAENAQAAVVGGDPYPTSGSAAYYCVAYERTSGGATSIRARLVRPDDTLVGTTDTPIAAFPGQDHRAPAISKSNGGTEWMLAWERRDTVSMHSEILGARVRWNGDVTAAAFLVAPSVPYEPRVSVSSPLAGRDEYAVAWQEPTGPGTREIRLALLDGSTVASTLNLTEAEGLGTARAPSDPSVDCDGEHFMVAYADGLSPFAPSQVLASEVGISGGALTPTYCYPVDLVPSPPASLVRIAGLRPAGETGPSLQQAYLLVWDVRAPGGIGDVLGAEFRGTVGGLQTRYCFGDGSGTACPCGNASATWQEAGCLNSFGNASQLGGFGGASVTNDTFNLVASDIPLNAPAPTFFQGTSTPNGLPGGTVFGDGLRCVTGNQIRLGPVVSGSPGFWSLGAAFPGTPHVTFAGAIPLAGATRYYQALYRNAATFCTSATFNTTNGYRVVWEL